MELAQIFILALCVVSVMMERCHNETELETVAQKKLKRYPPPPNMAPSLNSSFGCPVEELKSSASGPKNDRSLSPWKYETVHDPEYYPNTYSQAVCLCQGCIIANSTGTVTDNKDYNSVELNGTWVFAKRVKCTKNRYKLVLERREVAVGCTCVRPLFSRLPPDPASPLAL